MNTSKSSIHAAFAVVGVTGLEPMASWSRTKRSTKLSYTPRLATYLLYSFCRMLSISFPPDFQLIVTDSSFLT